MEWLKLEIEASALGLVGKKRFNHSQRPDEMALTGIHNALQENRIVQQPATQLAEMWCREVEEPEVLAVVAKQSRAWHQPNVSLTPQCTTSTRVGGRSVRVHHVLVRLDTWKGVSPGCVGASIGGPQKGLPVTIKLTVSLAAKVHRVSWT